MGTGKTLGTIGGAVGGTLTVIAGAPVISQALTGLAGLMGVGSGLAASLSSGLAAANASVASIIPALGAKGAVGTWLTGLTSATVVPVGAGAPVGVTVFGGLSGFLATTVGLSATAAPIAAATLLAVGVITAGFLINKIVKSAGESLDKSSDNAKQQASLQRTRQRQQELQKQQQKQRSQQLQQEAKLAKQHLNDERQTQKQYGEIADSYGKVQQEQQKTHAARVKATKAKEQIGANKEHTTHVEALENRRNKPDVMAHMPLT